MPPPFQGVEARIAIAHILPLRVIYTTFGHRAEATASTFRSTDAVRASGRRTTSSQSSVIGPHSRAISAPRSDPGLLQMSDRGEGHLQVRAAVRAVRESSAAMIKRWMSLVPS